MYRLSSYHYERLEGPARKQGVAESTCDRFDKFGRTARCKKSAENITKKTEVQLQDCGLYESVINQQHGQLFKNFEVNCHGSTDAKPTTSQPK